MELGKEPGHILDNMDKTFIRRPPSYARYGIYTYGDKWSIYLIDGRLEECRELLGFYRIVVILEKVERSFLSAQGNFQVALLPPRFAAPQISLLPGSFSN